ncbi:NUDIX hydrolase domain-like protein [Sordaria brevicollis]|uniref:NUDIX hydrolase domain-like protein n=1 Tax=Sordaria brevicollis TaxID=83679 RepID=A0AAE0P9I4_SORBR|nr:NUDIX hydrolase domain-like protein [Sordaria brevicollis]
MASKLASDVVRTGVAVIITDAEGKVLVGVRKGSHGAGTIQFPGGHLEKGEAIFDCAKRETLEETGLEVKDLKFVTITNDIFAAEDKHYITIFVSCRRVDEEQKPVIMEPEKCESWTWRSEAELRELMATEDGQKRLFLPIVNLFKDHESLSALL